GDREVVYKHNPAVRDSGRAPFDQNRRDGLAIVGNERQTIFRRRAQNERVRDSDKGSFSPFIEAQDRNLRTFGAHLFGDFSGDLLIEQQGQHYSALSPSSTGFGIVIASICGSSRFS